MDTQIIIPRRNCGDIIGARDSKSRSITFAQATWAFDELKFRDNAAIGAAIDLSWPEKLLARTDVEVLHPVELITYYSWWRIGEWKNVSRRGDKSRDLLFLFLLVIENNTRRANSISEKT